MKKDLFLSNSLKLNKTNHSKPTVVAQNTEHLKSLIENEIQKCGNKCDLNHIDVSQITDMAYLFHHSEFNGNISEWNTSNVNNMNSMFKCSNFNGDISNWDVSNVWNMSEMFFRSNFNKSIVKWDVSKVRGMYSMFEQSAFSEDLSDWKPYSAQIIKDAFFNCPAPIPFWVEHFLLGTMEKAIKIYHLEKGIIKELNEGLNKNKTSESKKLKL
jgi:surface protein